MDRRRFLQTLAAGTCAIAVPTCVCHARRTIGCGLALGSGDSDVPDRLSSCGVAEIDAFCRQEVDELNDKFALVPSFGFFDDGDQLNAFALEPGAYGAGSPAAVVLGINLARKIHGSASTLGMLPIAAILAHEWGHTLQFQKKMDGGWSARHELHADYLAGWYLGATRGSDRDLMAKIAKVFGELGDTQFLDTDHHGTPKQRANVMRAGANSFVFADGRVPDGVSADKLPESAEAAFERGLWTVRH